MCIDVLLTFVNALNSYLGTGCGASCVYGTIDPTIPKDSATGCYREASSRVRSRTDTLDVVHKVNTLPPANHARLGPLDFIGIALWAGSWLFEIGTSLLTPYDVSTILLEANSLLKSLTIRRVLGAAQKRIRNMMTSLSPQACGASVGIPSTYTQPYTVRLCAQKGLMRSIGATATSEK